MHLTLTAIMDGVPYVFETDQLPGESRGQTVQRLMDDVVWPFFEQGGYTSMDSVSWAWS